MGSMIHMRRLHLSRSCASFPDSPFSDKYFLMMANQHGFDLPLLLFSGASTILSALSSLPMTWYRTDLTTCRAHFPLDCQANSAVTWYPRYTYAALAEQADVCLWALGYKVNLPSSGGVSEPRMDILVERE